MRLFPALALLLLGVPLLLAITEFNCNSICAGAFCQDSSNSPAPRQGETAIKYSTESPPLLNRFGNGVFCGAFTLSRCIVPNACLQSGGGGGGGGGGGIPPACASVSISIPGQIPVSLQPGQSQPPLTDFWGYNFTSDWLNQCDPQAPPGQRCGMVPSLMVEVECRDSNQRSIPCPVAPTYSASVGTLQPDPMGDVPTRRIWRSVNYPTPVAITATVNGCASNSKTVSFNHHILNACSLTPSSATLDFGQNKTFSGTCYDETLQSRPCYYPLIIHPLPNQLGRVVQDRYPTGVPPDSLTPIGDNGARLWMDSTVNFTAASLDAVGSLSGGGPTFSCYAPIMVGNPATACTLALSSDTVQVGKTIQATPSCTGPKGPASCPDMNFWAAPAAVVSWSNYSQANVTGLYVGSATVDAHSAPFRQTCVLDQTVTFFDTVEPEITTCSYVPHDVTASLNLPADATSIRAYLVSGGTDDGCTKIDVNGQHVFDEGCDAGYRYASCGLHVKAHDLFFTTPLPVPLTSGANTLRGQNVDSYGAFSALRIRITGTYQATQCTGLSIPVPPLSCQAALTVTPGTCNTPPLAGSFLPDESTRFDQLPPGDLESVPNLVLARPDFRIQYASDVFACAQDFDGGIRSRVGFLAVDATRFHSTVYRPAAPITITLRNLPYNQVPRLFVLDEFADAPDPVFQRGQNCADIGRCTNLQYDSIGRTLTFQTTGFSTYATQDASATPTPTPTPCAGPSCPSPSPSPTLCAGPSCSSPTPTPSTTPTPTTEPTPTPNPPEIRFILDCPLPQLGQNTTRASAFLYINGTPSVNATMALEFDLNESYAFETYPVSTDPSSGRHDFVIDTRFGGTYELQAVSGNYSSNECRLDVFEEQANKVPDLHEGLILLVFAAAGLLAYTRRTS